MVIAQAPAIDNNLKVIHRTNDKDIFDELFCMKDKINNMIVKIAKKISKEQKK